MKTNDEKITELELKVADLELTIKRMIKLFENLDIIVTDQRKINDKVLKLESENTQVFKMLEKTMEFMHNQMQINNRLTMGFKLINEITK